MTTTARQPLTVDEFWAQVDRTDDCWLWTGRTAPDGYGTKRTVDGRSGRPHQHAFWLLVGEVPEGLELDHLCRVRNCVNPDHLEPVTHRENILRGTSFMATKAAQTHCEHGHEFTPENTFLRSGGRRGCRECARRHSREWRARRRQEVAS